MSEEERHMDAAIEAALQGESFLAAPVTLHRRVVERLRFAALRDQERLRFRYSMVTFALALLGAVAATAVLVSVTNFDVVISRGVAGGRGTLDYYQTSMLLYFMHYSGAYSLVLSVLAALGTVLLGLIPLRKYISSH